MADPKFSTYDPEKVVDLTTRRKSGGPPPGDGDMEARVSSLETKFDKIETQMASIGTDLAYIKGKLDGMPSAVDFGELKGRVNSLPTTAKIATIVSIVVGLFTVITKWPEVTAFLN